jgi:DNA-binding MarR family transcriptional regulator
VPNVPDRHPRVAKNACPLVRRRKWLRAHPRVGIYPIVSTTRPHGDTNGLGPEQLGAVLDALRSSGSDLSLPLLMTLVAVAREPGLSVNELAERVQVPQQTASRYVGILQGRYQMPAGSENSFAADPLLSLQVSGNDPRRRALFLTRRGKQRLVQFIKLLYRQEVSNES